MNKDNTYLVVTPFFPTENNFVGIYIYDQLHELRSQTSFNIEIIKVVSILSIEHDYIFDDFKIKVFKVFDLPFFIFPGLFNLINKKRLSRFIKNNRINKIKFIHSHVSYPSAYIVEDLDGKKIIQHHGLDVLQLSNGRIEFIKKIQKNYLINNTIKKLNKFDLQIAVSNLVLTKLNSYKKYYPNNEYVLYNGVNNKKFFNIKNSKNSVFTIGCVANFWKIKDQITLIKSIQHLISNGVKVKLRLVGTGPTFNKCLKYVKNNNLDDYVCFEREMPHNKLNFFFNHIDLFVLPSFYEALGCVYLESWATETPFIAIKDQGIAEIVPNKKIMLANAKDFIDLSNKIYYFTQNKTIIKLPSSLNISSTISKYLSLSLFNNA